MGSQNDFAIGVANCKVTQTEFKHWNWRENCEQIDK